MATLNDSIEQELAELERAGLRRELRPLNGVPGPLVHLGERAVTSFCSNDYLGLAGSPLLAEAIRAAATLGAGAGASRLIAGNFAAHRTLEADLATWLDAEATLLFNSGYHANIGLLSAVAGPDDLILSDALNHASLIDGCRLARARVLVYPHGDVHTAGRMLATERGGKRRAFIVTESLFSMDGDVAPLNALSELAQSYDCGLIVDDAHAVGVRGLNGRGLAWPLPTFARIATFGKAIGTFGACVAGSRALVDLLLSTSRAFVFTTALPPVIVAATSAALNLIGSDYGEIARVHLRRLIDQLGLGLHALGLAPSGSHIVPLRVRGGESATAMRVCEHLLARGLYVQGIRPPTVPAGSARLRLSLSAAHTTAQLAALLAALTELRDEFAT